MTNFDSVLDAAKERQNIKSDRALSIALLLRQNAVWQYRKHGGLPSDETMLKLAELAHIEPEEALLMLSVWRTTGRAKGHYTSILKKFSAVLIGGVLMLSPLAAPDANALILNDNTSNKGFSSKSLNINYARSICRRKIEMSYSRKLEMSHLSKIEMSHDSCNRILYSKTD